MSKNFDIDGPAIPVEKKTSEQTVYKQTYIEPEEHKIHGLNQAEYNDPNGITVTIPDKKKPVVVLFGPTECGKTMTLIRMTRYLNENGYIVKPVKTFRPSADSHYARMCEEYNELVNSSNAAHGTDMISFMLVEVIDSRSRSICYILEAPGEYYFNPKKPNIGFPAYVNTICHSNNKKVWVFMVEPDWKDESDRRKYVDRIKEVKQKMKIPRDQAVFLYNKVDKSNFVDSIDRVNISSVKNDIEVMYPGIFKPFVNDIPILSWFKPYNCDLVPFSNGSFTTATKADGTEYLTFQSGPDEFPRKLWNSIKKIVIG